MSKTFKLGGIFLISVVSLQVFRILFSLIPLSDNLAGWLFSLLFQVGCLGLIPFFLYRAWISKDKLALVKDFRLKTKINPLSWLLAVVIGFLVFYINTGVSALWYIILNLLDYTYISSAGTIYSSPEVLIFEIITTAMLPAIFEEFTDRGLLLAVFEEKSDNFKIVAAGIMFGLLHQNVAQLTPTMFGGIVMAFMAVKSSSILPGMIVHFLNNFLVIMLEFSSQTDGVLKTAYQAYTNFYSYNFFIALLTCGGAVAILVFCLKQFEKINTPHKEPQKTEEPAPVIKDPDEVMREIYYSPYKFTDFDSVYGVNGQRPQPVIIAAPHVSPAAPATNKTKWWEYGLIYCAVFATALTTIFTYVWGVLR